MAAISRAGKIFSRPPVQDPSPIPSSSPAFGTPIHPLRPSAKATAAAPSTKAAILPILIPPPTLRPLAFRTFTKKHNLTLTSTALQSLATFVGRHCGSGWREEGLAEKVLEEVARTWKKSAGPVIVEGDTDLFRSILKTLEGCMSGGRILPGKGSINRQGSFAFADTTLDPENSDRDNKASSLSSPLEEINALHASTRGDEDDDESINDPRQWLKVIDAYEQPRLMYNINKRSFEKVHTLPSLFSLPSHQTDFFRQRYHLIHQRLLHNESFQPSSFTASRSSQSHGSRTQHQSYKITPIANLLGRSGSSHLILGLLTVAPTGTLAISDLTGSIALDLSNASSSSEDGTLFAPGMLVLADGMYEEEYMPTSNLGNTGGIGGTIGGKLVCFYISHPPAERRANSLGIKDDVNPDTDVGNSVAGGFGWTDFLGVGSERAMGVKMRRLERRVLHTRRLPDLEAAPEARMGVRDKVVFAGECNLDNPSSLTAIRAMLSFYAKSPQPPLSIVLLGNFVTHAALASPSSSSAADASAGSVSSMEYKEAFDALDSVLADFHELLPHTTWIFVPGDNDPWPSAWSAGASTPVPRKGVPDVFVSRLKRTFASAKSELRDDTRPPAAQGSGVDRSAPSEPVWTSNPTRMSLFGPVQEMVVFRDDISSRIRRTALKMPSAEQAQQQTPNGAADEAVRESRQSMVDSDGDTAMPCASPSREQTAVDSNTLAARKLTRTLLDQGHLSPFPLSTRPIHVDYAGSLNLYPLPTLLALCDVDLAPFALTYMGCHVLNCGKILQGRGKAGWVEYDVTVKKGKIKGVVC